MPTKKTETTEVTETKEIVPIETEKKKEEKPKKFYQRIAHVQRELKAPKSRHNDFGNYNYRSLEDICEAVKALCEENDLLLFLTDEPVVIDGWHYIKATALLADSLETNREPLKVTAYAREPLEKKKMDGSQVTGTASSYARKYALNGMFLIDDTKDADTNEYQKQTMETESKPAGIGKKYAEILEKAIGADGAKWALEHYKVKSLEYLTKAQYNELVTRIKKNEDQSEDK